MVRSENARRRYNAAWAIKSREDLAYVHEFYVARQGPAHGFRYKDWLDFTTASDHQSPSAFDDQVIGTGDGVTTTFRLRKTYVSGPTSRLRYLTKPVSGTVTVGKDGVAQASGWSVDTTTGLVTFTVAPANGVSVTAGCEFDVPVQFAREVSWPEALQASIDDFGHGSVQDIPLVELPDGLEVDDDVNCGGAVEVCLLADYQLAPGYARSYFFEANVAGLTVKLSDLAITPPGHDVFRIVNLGPESFDVETFAGASFITLASGEAADCSLTLNSGGDKVWYAT